MFFLLQKINYTLLVFAKKDKQLKFINFYHASESEATADYSHLPQCYTQYLQNLRLTPNNLFILGLSFLFFKFGLTEPMRYQSAIEARILEL